MWRPASSLLAVGPTSEEKETKDKRYIYNDRHYASGALIRHCCRLPTFEDLGNIALIICEKGVQVSPLVPRHFSSVSWKSSWTFFVSVCLALASAGVTPKHSGGRFSWCRTNESERAKKSPQSPQNEILRGCASIRSQCLLKLSQLRNPASGHSRHFSPWTVPRAKSPDVASRRLLC